MVECLHYLVHLGFHHGLKPPTTITYATYRPPILLPLSRRRAIWPCQDRDTTPRTTRNFPSSYFDTQHRISGLWPAGKGDTEGLVHPFMIANQSKHTVQFSNLTWEPGSAELLRGWQIWRYLARYQKRYSQGARLQLGTTVVSATPESISTATKGKPDVKWRAAFGSPGRRTEGGIRVAICGVGVLR